MSIKGCKTIAEYKAIRQKRVELWFSSNFEPGFSTYEIIGNVVRVTDYTGDSIEVSLSEIL